MTEILKLIPTPQEVHVSSGRVGLDGAELLVERDRGMGRALGRLINEEIARLGGATVPVRVIAGRTERAPAIVAGDPSGFVALRARLEAAGIRADRRLGTEGYQLHAANNEVLLAANTEAGLWWGAQTLIQLLRSEAIQGRGIGLPEVDIVDWPTFAMRGYVDDVARGQVSKVRDFKRIVQRLSSLKLNLYTLYLEDMFEFHGHPKIGAGRGRLTRKEVAELIAHANRHRITIVPAIQTLGHMERILGLPDYAHLREVSDYPYLLGVTRKGAYELLESLIAEICEAFPGPYMLAGADEAFGLGKGASRRRAAELGESGIWLSHVKRVRDIARHHGKTMIVPCDMFDEHYYREVWGRASPFPFEEVYGLPRDVIPLIGTFGPVAEYPTLIRLTEAGFTPLAVTGLSNWLRIFPRFKLAVANITTMASAARSADAAGVMGASFCDLGADNLREQVWYGVGALAEQCWRQSNDSDVQKAFLTQFYGYDGPELAHAYRILGHLDDYFPPLPDEAPALKAFLNRAWPWLYEPISTGIHNLSLSSDEQDLLKDLRDELKAVLAAIRRAKPQVRWHAEHLDYLELAARLTDHLSRRLLLQAGGVSVAKRRQLDRLASELEQIAELYRHLWLRTNKQQGLSYNLARFAKLADAYRLGRGSARLSDQTN